MLSRPNVSVVICAYTDERWDDLLCAIESVRVQRVPAKEIVVVIDHNDGMLHRLGEAAPDVLALANREQRGLSGGRNTGIEAAAGEVVAFLDDDAIAEPDWLETLAVAYDDPSVIGAGGVIRPLWLDAEPEWFPPELLWVVGCTYRGMPTTRMPVRNLLGCNMSFRREVFIRAGGFRHGMGRIGKVPLGCEETEFCIRALKAWPGGAILYEPGAAVRHRVPAARASWDYLRARCYAEGLSKAQVARFAGKQRGLATERAYVARTLPLGVLAGLGQALLGRGAGLARAAAIVNGLGCTVAGYVRGSLAAAPEQVLTGEPAVQGL
ncbi:MAG: glycosyltransferase family 2 protein [Chloroflexi bacterium]|nr:glycosyltransferase family 2 protein [Chloroflexota bacterium]